jgi:hypothetical protein
MWSEKCILEGSTVVTTVQKSTYSSTIESSLHKEQLQYGTV